MNKNDIIFKAYYNSAMLDDILIERIGIHMDVSIILERFVVHREHLSNMLCALQHIPCRFTNLVTEEDGCGCVLYVGNFKVCLTHTDCIKLIDAVSELWKG